MESIYQFFHVTFLGLVLLLPMANPLTSMTLLISLGGNLSEYERLKQVRQASLYSVGIMLVTYYAGSFVLSMFSISLPGMRIAGGLILGYIGFLMLFPKPDPVPEFSAAPVGDNVSKDAKPKTSSAVPNIAFVPLAMPGLAGPGTIALILSATAQLQETPVVYAKWILMTVPLLVASLLGLLCYVCLRSANRLVAIFGESTVDAVSRIMGFLIICMGVQFIIGAVVTIVHDPALASP